MLRTLPREPFLDLTEMLTGRSLYYIGAGSDPAAVVVLSAAHRPLLDPIYRHRVHYCTENWTTATNLAPTTSWFHRAQPLGNQGEWLLAGSAARSSGTPNVTVYSDMGEPIRSFRISGDIIDIQATDLPTQEFWVAYEFESRDSIADIGDGSPGLACFRGDGQPSFIFNQDFRQDAPPIRYCHALNVSNRNAAWVCYASTGFSDFSSFAAINWSQRSGDFWEKIPGRTCQTFATDGRRILCDGLYDAHATSVDRLRLFSLDDPDKREEIIPLDPDGDPIPMRETFGRGPYFYIHDWNGKRVYRIDMRDL